MFEAVTEKSKEWLLSMMKGNTQHEGVLSFVLSLLSATTVEVGKLCRGHRTSHGFGCNRDDSSGREKRL
jgi:hypothetical protein